MHGLEKDAYEREMQVLQKKLSDLQHILDDKETVSSVPRSSYLHLLFSNCETCRRVCLETLLAREDRRCLELLASTPV